VLVTVDKFSFLTILVVMKMEECKEVPTILGRPFLKTTRMIIDVDK